MTTITLEVRKAADDTWHWRRRVNGRITAHGADYNSKASAVRGLVDDMMSTAECVAGIGHHPILDHEKAMLRKHLRKQVVEVA